MAAFCWSARHPHNAYKQEAGKIVARIEEFLYVYNELRLGKPVSIGCAAACAWITSSGGRHVGTKRTSTAHQGQVVTENSEVFLIGLVTRQERNRPWESHATSAGSSGDQGLQGSPELIRQRHIKSLVTLNTVRPD